MDQQEWKKVNNIVDTALELEGEERTTYINEQCGDNEQLRYQVTELLESIEQSDTEDFLEATEAFPAHLAADLSDDEDQPHASSLVGETIGQYHIKKLIGHGGMGSVFLADRADEAYEGQVALKLMRQGMDTPSNIARFERERNILAKLDHPNIARLLDGGVTDAGLPYLVMEYVDGISLFEYCDKKNLPVEQRLDLFKEVCRAVRHAHKNAVIHRDLKPSNILITQDGNVKVLDFGIAKLLESEDSGSTQFQTRTGARILTYRYAAPDQIEGQPVTTSTDVYTLGTLLYQLLCGVHPFDLDNKDLTEIEDIIRRQSPNTLTQRFNQLPEDLQKQLARRRNTISKTLTKILSGDIGAIAMKVLRKEPEKRYRSAGNILEDLKRREQNLPVIARKDTVRYKVGKFVRRHKNGLAIAAGVFLLVIGLTVFYTWQLAEERNKAQLEANKAQQVSSFLTDIFRASNPYYNPQDTLTAAIFLKRGQERINKLNDQPQVQAKLLEVLGRAYTEIGQFNKAKPLLQKSQRIRKDEIPNSNLASSLDALAVLHRLRGNFTKAESLNRKTLSIVKKQYGNNHKKTANTLDELALVLDQKGEYKTADSVYKRTLQIKQAVLDSNNTHIANTLNNRAGVLKKLDQLKKAEVLYRQALRIWKKNYGDYHPSTSMGYGDLGMILNMQRQFKQADSLYQKAIEIDQKIYDGPNRHTATVYNNLGILHAQQGKLKESEKYFSKSLDYRRAIFNKTHPQITQSLSNLGQLYLKTSQPDKALPLFKSALKNDKANFGENHSYVANDFYTIGLLNKKKGLYSQAKQDFQKSITIYKKTLPTNHRKTADALFELGNIFKLQDKHQKAIPPLREAFKIRTEKLDKSDIRLTKTKIKLGVCLAATQSYKEAEKLLKNGYQTFKQEQGVDSADTQQAREYLIELYEAWNKPALASKYKNKNE